MALDREDREFIAEDLRIVCQYEMEEAISGRNADRDLQLCGFAWASALQCKVDSERRMQILRSLGDVRWQDDYAQIRDCIKRLDAYIAVQGESFGAVVRRGGALSTWLRSPRPTSRQS